MKTKELLEALKVLSVKHRRQYPDILNFVYIDEDKLLVTDLEVTTTYTMKTGVKNPTCLRIKALLDIVKNLPDGVVTIEGGNILINGSIFGVVEVRPASEFPQQVELGEMQASIPFDMSVELKKSLKFSAVSDVRCYLNGSLFEIKGNVLNFVSTDGHRLHKHSYDTMTAEDAQWIASREFIQKVVSTMKKKSVKPVLYKGHIEVTMGSLNIIGKLIDGRYPDYPRVIERNKPNKVTADVKSLLGALKTAKASTTDKMTPLVITSDVDGTCTLTIDKTDVSLPFNGHNNLTKACPIVRIGINANYLIDILSVYEGDTIELCLDLPDRDGNVNASIYATEGGGEFVLMPVRVTK